MVKTFVGYALVRGLLVFNRKLQNGTATQRVPRFWRPEAGMPLVVKAGGKNPLHPHSDQMKCRQT
jgi:hypothetical protein